MPKNRTKPGRTLFVKRYIQRMKPVQYIEGFSKLSRAGRTDYLGSILPDAAAVRGLLDSFCPADENFLKKFLEFSENTVSAYHLPFGVAPNFLINGKVYHIPMVIEESSVVAAASNAAKFWWKRGGFRTRVVSAVKAGQVHFLSDAPPGALLSLNQRLEPFLMERVSPVTARMMERGGGVVSAAITTVAPPAGLLPVRCTFDTVDSMGPILSTHASKRWRPV